jgi:hypothetical protein
VKGASIHLTGKLFGMLSEVFDRSDTECDIPICFVPDATEGQINVVRDQIVSLIDGPSLATARTLAFRLRDYTTHKSGLGLLFFILGSENGTHKVVISRFPADQGILAEARGRSLEVEFLERIFMKRATSYKAVVYSGSSFDDHFWDGAAIDKQIGEHAHELANYWIHGFLGSQFKTTPQAGTRRLALAIRDALTNAPSTEVKQEIIAFATLIPRQGGHTFSADRLMSQFQLSPETRDCLMKEFDNSRVANEQFTIDPDEFKVHLRLRSVDLDSGVSMIAPADTFDQKIVREPIPGQAESYRFSTTGKIVDETLRKGR